MWTNPRRNSLRSSTLTESAGRFAVELTELDNLVQRLSDAIETIDRIVGGLGEHASAARLHWTGPAADAYVVVLDKWNGSAQDLIALLVEMRTMAQDAQSCYCDTYSTNLKMLGRI